MSLFRKSGNLYFPSEPSDYTDSLPAGTYTVGCTPHGELYLSRVDDMTVRTKIYGKSNELCERIFNTFIQRPAATGVLLDGEKGSGKTLLTKLLSIRAREAGIPTIVINSPLSGDGFNSFIQSIEQPAVIVFDEFEKNYRGQEQQGQLLTLLDGVYPTKKLFVLTSNDKYRVNSHMINRPGRIFYFIEYKGLDTDFIREYCEDNLLDKSHIDGVITVSSLFSQFNFDLLQALVEEMNRYGESPIVAMEYLNAKPFSERADSHFEVRVFANDIELPAQTYNRYITINPLTTASQVAVWLNAEDDVDTAEGVISVTESEIHRVMAKIAASMLPNTNDGHTNMVRTHYAIELRPEGLVEVNPTSGKYTYESEIDGIRFNVLLVKPRVKNYRWQDAF